MCVRECGVCMQQTYNNTILKLPNILPNHNAIMLDLYLQEWADTTVSSTCQYNIQEYVQYYAISLPTKQLYHVAL